MGIEIERKFLVKDDSWKEHADDGLVCKQGYLASDRDKTVRIRVMGEKAFLTIKGATYGLSRSEYEYEIPVIDAEGMLQFCATAPVEKTRYLIEHVGMTWELDVFMGANAGLIMAEIELDSEDQPFELPAWAGEEVSGDVRFYNSHLAQKPFTRW
ncbi:Inorganic triphosphatase [Pontiella desulfatans]|uniref:Inorganic triphosphatase n=1 Tax=Pontiella desulfatans TaxID=2750659 RepID=A0A6C2TZA8_PONDE|nr:CYTH domain-containing protein [Pontiella desulfatans]VGO12947.1 Inorganic triphosphatase [Pontiella desulfatans]